MKDPENNHDASANWLDAALREFLHAPDTGAAAEPLPADLRQRCREAALGALDLLQMQQYRSRLATRPASLPEHFKELAQLAEVSLGRVFLAIGIKPNAEVSDATSIRGLAELAQHLGLSRDEAVLRLRWGIAQIAGAALPAEWPTLATAADGQCAPEPALNMPQLDEVLRRCEARYTPTHDIKLCDATKMVDDVYAQNTESIANGHAARKCVPKDRPPLKAPLLVGKATSFCNEVCLLRRSCSLRGQQPGAPCCDQTCLLLQQLGDPDPAVGIAAADHLRLLWLHRPDDVFQCLSRFTERPVSASERRTLDKRLQRTLDRRHQGSLQMEVCGYCNHEVGVEPQETVAWLRNPTTEVYKAVVSPRLRVFMARADVGSKRFNAVLLRRHPYDHFIVVNNKLAPGTKDWLQAVSHEFIVHILGERGMELTRPAKPPEPQSKSEVYAETQLHVDVDEKQIAARWAANEIPLASGKGISTGAGIFFDAGSQCLLVYDEIRDLILQHRFANLTIFTNNYLILRKWISDSLIPEMRGTEVGVAGDFFDVPHLAFYGQSLPAKLLSGEFRPSAVFIGTSGIEFQNDKVLLGYHAGDLEREAKKLLFQCDALARVILTTPHKIGSARGRVFDMLSVEGPGQHAPIYLVTAAPEPKSAEESQYLKAQEAFQSQSVRDALSRKHMTVHWIELERNAPGIPKPLKHIIVPGQNENA